MSNPRYNHTVQLTADVEALWVTYQHGQAEPLSFNAFVNRLIRQEMELLCVTAAPTSTIR